MQHTSSSLLFLRTETVTFPNISGEDVTLESVVQDSMPSGSPIGTVVGLHGAPGTHNDFKYVMPHLTEMGIRFVGINYPGMGLTPNHETLRYTNPERNNFVLAILDALQLKENVVFLGHSRGAQNGFQLAAHDQSERCRGVIMANPTGLRPHKSYPPHFLVRGFRRLYIRFTFMRSFWHLFMNFVYNNILGLRVSSGEAACAAYRCLEHIEFAGSHDWIQKWNQTTTTGKRLVIAYGARDNLIEEAVSEEFSRSFEEAVHFTVDGRDEEHESEAVDWMKEHLQKTNTRNLVVCFKKDDHFLQKHKARFLAESAASILKSSNNN